MNNQDIIRLLSNIRSKVEGALRLRDLEVLLEKIDKN